MIFSHGTSGSRDVCVAFRYNLEYKLLSPEISDKEGRYIILRTEIQGTPFLLIIMAQMVKLNKLKFLNSLLSI